MSVEFEASADGRYFWLDAYSTNLLIGLSADEDEDGGIAINLEADEARRLRRFLEYVYPAREEEGLCPNCDRPLSDGEHSYLSGPEPGRCYIDGVAPDLP